MACQTGRESQHLEITARSWTPDSERPMNAHFSLGSWRSLQDQRTDFQGASMTVNRWPLIRPCEVMGKTTHKDTSMNSELRYFISRFIGTVLLALAPVVFTAFVSMPLSLNRHPGEKAQVDVPPRHMT
jgi:hypothetical protein